MLLIGCAQQKQSASNDATSETENSSEAVEPVEVPEKCFVAHKYSGGTGVYGAGGYALLDLQGEEIPLADESWMPQGEFTEGYVLVTWETSEYDEEWKTEHDKVTHYGLVDKTGELAIDLTDSLNALGDEMNFYTDGLAFVDGRLVIFCDGSLGLNDTLAVFDLEGNLVYTLGDTGRQVSFDLSWSSDYYHDGVICVEGPGSLSAIVDESGNVLARSGENGDSLESFGKGYMSAGYDPTAVTDYAGNVLFDATTVNVAGDVEDAALCYDQPRAGGLVVVQATKVNPYGGKNKDLYGLYSISAGKWIVPLSDGFQRKVIADDGLAVVKADAKAFITDGYGATDDDEVNDFCCLMDYQGNVVLEPDSEVLTDAAASMSSFEPYYLQDHFWYIGSSDDGSIVAYIVDGEVIGVYVVDFPIPASYPNN